MPVDDDILPHRRHVQMTTRRSPAATSLQPNQGSRSSVLTAKSGRRSLRIALTELCRLVDDPPGANGTCGRRMDAPTDPFSWRNLDICYIPVIMQEK
jgi:hypothetical protein